MNSRAVKVLAVLVIVLFAAVFALNRAGDQGAAADELLLPLLKDRLDEVSAVTVTDADGEVTISRGEGGWIVPGRDGYPADTDVLRELLLAIAEARKVEQKTSNPELYGRLGVEDPTVEGSSSVLVKSAGLADSDFSLILGDPVQREYRYVRVADAEDSWLVDRNPEIPDDAAGWLASDIVDIASSRIQAVTITHENGDSIDIRKENEDATNFEVADIPEGRELSYPSVANSIAAALSNLTLQDVRAAGESGAGEADASEPATTTDFTTFDGLRVTVESTGNEDETWISLSASVVPDADGARPEPAISDGGAATDSPDSEAQDSETADSETQEAAEAQAAPDAPGEADETTTADEAEEPDPAAEAAAINERVAGWEYRIASYQANQLTRRWEDLLKAEEE